MHLNKFLGCVFGVAIGDALGMPFETMKAAEISLIEEDLHQFLPHSINLHTFNSIKDLPPGSWTDDTQLTLVTLESLIESSGEFDMDIIAKRHVEAFRSSARRGWGRSTRNACQRLEQGILWRLSGEPDGAGNGVMMKIAPLALLRSRRIRNLEYFFNECIAFGKMTHLATPAIVAGAVHALAIIMLALTEEDERIDFYQFLQHLKDVAKVFEKQLPEHIDKISHQINRIMLLYRSGRLMTETPASLAARFGGGTKAAFSAYNSFALSYAMFVKTEGSFEGVFEVIRAGGDTDTNASIIGSLVGAWRGIGAIPDNLVQELEQSELVRARTCTFFDACGNA